MSGRAFAFFRRRSFILNEVSTITGGHFLCRLPQSPARGAHEDSSSRVSTAEPNLAGEQQRQEQQRDSDSLAGLAVPRLFPHVSDTSQQQQQERQTQELLVRALQHLLGIGAESLQLLDIDGEVRHFSVLYETLHFKW